MFLRCCQLNSAIGGSTNAPIHLNAIAKHIGVELNCDDWERVGYSLPLLVNIQPAGQWLCEEYHRAGGLPGEFARYLMIRRENAESIPVPTAVVAELLKHDALPHPDALTVSGKSIGENCRDDFSHDRRVILDFNKPLMKEAGFLHLKGSLFNSAIMKTSVISKAFREQYLSNPDDPMAFEGPVAVFNGPEDYHHRIEENPDIGQGTILVMRGAGPKGYPGAAEVSRFILNGA